jgi:hypothetical protein
MLSLSSRDTTTPDAKLPTETARICKSCGAGHFREGASVCHGCGRSLDGAQIVAGVFRIENVATQPAERITANDEERQRQGFELQTTFQWAVRDQKADISAGAAADADGPVVQLVYGPGATITRLNLGLRRRSAPEVFGFNIDPISGHWARNEDESTEAVAPTTAKPQRIVPSVQDRKNALLVKPADEELDEVTFATVQHALLRGIESVFQLEEGEVLAEPMPRRDERKGFLLYEATEGGAGVLTRLVAEQDSLAEIAARALLVLHFDVESDRLPEDERGLTDLAGTSCVAACYRCLMSYYNQPDHELLDRRNEKARRILLRLARSTTQVKAGPAAPPAPDAQGEAPADAGKATPRKAGKAAPAKPPPEVEPDSALCRWLALAAERGLPVPDPEPHVDGKARFPLVWRQHYAAAVLGKANKAAVDRLLNSGFEVIVFEGSEESWSEPFAALAAALGR